MGKKKQSQLEKIYKSHGMTTKVVSCLQQKPGLNVLWWGWGC